jgi:hypothetical protein
MAVFSTEPGMAVTVNVRPTWIHLKELAERTAPDLRVPKPRVENAKGWTVGYKDGPRVEMSRQTSKIDPDIGVGFFKRAAHERQGELIANERESPTLDLPSVDRSDAIGSRIQLDEVIVPHDVENRRSRGLKQLDQNVRLVPLCLLRRLESIQASQEIAREDDGLNVVFLSNRQ